jgi:crossover junction endodeoxyribonuclease RusA
LSGDVSLDIVSYAEGVSGDLDNLLKPIQDALQGIAYNNDKQVRELKGARRDIDERYKVRFMPVVLGAAFADGRPFIHIRIWRRLETRELS